jgi:hypothetical protein
MATFIRKLSDADIEAILDALVDRLLTRQENHSNQDKSTVSEVASDVENSVYQDVDTYTPTVFRLTKCVYSKH